MGLCARYDWIDEDADEVKALRESAQPPHAHLQVRHALSPASLHAALPGMHWVPRKYFLLTNRFHCIDLHGRQHNHNTLVMGSISMQALLVGAPLAAPLPGAAAAAPAVPAVVLSPAAVPAVEIEVAVEPGAAAAVLSCDMLRPGMQDSFWQVCVRCGQHNSNNADMMCLL